jgi:hypothetical protein
MNAKLVSTVLAVAVLAATSAGCGHGKAGSGGGPSSGQDRAVGIRPSGNDVQDQWAKYVACMKDHGVENIAAMPGPKGGVRVGMSPNASRAEQAAFQALMSRGDRACRHLLHAQEHQVNAAEEARFRDGMFAFAKCVRSHGVDLPDPKIVRVAGGFDVTFPPKPGATPAQMSPNWQSAQAACQRLNPLLRSPK